MKRNNLFIAFIAVLCSCTFTQNTDQIIDPNPTQNISMQVVDSITGGEFYEIRIIDSMMVLLDLNNNHFLVSYSKNDYKKIKDFGMPGRGKNEYSFPFCIYRSPIDDTLSVFDVMYHKINSYPVNQLTKIPDCPKTQKLKEIVIGCMKPSMCNDDVYFSNNVKGAGIIMKYHIPDHSIQWINVSDKVTGIADDDPYRISKLRHSFIVDCQSDLIVVGFKHINKILFLNKNGDLKQSYQVGEDLYKPDVYEDIIITPESMVFTTSIIPSKEYVYVLYHGDTVEKYESGKPDKKSKLIVFDKKGNYIKTMGIDRLLLDGCVDEETNMFYGVESASGKESCIVSTKLND